MTDLDERFKIEGDPEETLRGLLKADPEGGTVEAERCPKMWQDKRCKLSAGHFGPCQYDV